MNLLKKEVSMEKIYKLLGWITFIEWMLIIAIVAIVLAVALVDLVS